MVGNEWAIRLTIQERRDLYCVAQSKDSPTRVALRGTVILMNAECAEA